MLKSNDFVNVQEFCNLHSDVHCSVTFELKIIIILKLIQSSTTWWKQYPQYRRDLEKAEQCKIQTIRRSYIQFLYSFDRQKMLYRRCIYISFLVNCVTCFYSQQMRLLMVKENQDSSIISIYKPLFNAQCRTTRRKFHLLSVPTTNQGPKRTIQNEILYQRIKLKLWIHG